MKSTSALLAVASLFWTMACDDGPPSSATPGGVTPPAQAPTPPSSGSFRGRVVDSLSGEPVSGARITAPGLAEASTAADGSFSFDLASSSSTVLVAEADAHWTRRTQVRASSGEVTVDILPTEGAFDLNFYDHVFRDVGTAGTHPWLQEPSFVIWDKVYECITFASGGACTS